jgi:hypothetical protein
MMRVAAMPQSVSFWPAHPTRPHNGVKEERGICSARTAERPLGLLTYVCFGSRASHSDQKVVYDFCLPVPHVLLPRGSFLRSRPITFHLSPTTFNRRFQPATAKYKRLVSQRTSLQNCALHDLAEPRP